jgi:hypothetical protein
MRTTGPAILMAICGVLAYQPVWADYVPPVKGNDTGGIISSSLIGQADVRAIAIDHCAKYGKVVKFLAAQNEYGGYISFACRWVPYARADQPPLRTRY